MYAKLFIHNIFKFVLVEINPIFAAKLPEMKLGQGHSCWWEGCTWIKLFQP